MRCFTYGRAGNFEAKTSQAIAERLGYEWTFVPATIGKHRAFFAGEDYARYLDFADSGCSLPFVQDMAPLIELKRSGYVPADAVIVNGNSGDFISGNHVPESMRVPAQGLSDDARWQRIIDALLKKHFSLWQSLATPKNRARIAELLRASIARAGGTLGAPETDHGLYEYAEFQDRQCRYVITGQRIYEFLGHEWRLPLWDNDYLQFWEGVPLAREDRPVALCAHAGECELGRRLAECAGQPQDHPPALAHSVPACRQGRACAARRRTLAPFRTPLSAILDGRDLQLGLRALWPRHGATHRGARHHIAWLAELYLGRHGVALDALAA